MGGKPYEGVILSPLKFMPGAVKEIDEERVAVIQQGQQKKAWECLWQKLRERVG